MNRACIAIVDANQARLFAYEHVPSQKLRDLKTLSGQDLAQSVVIEIDRIVRELALGHVIIVASPDILEQLREHDGVLRRDNLILDEIPRDLAKLTSWQLHDHLARIKLIPPRERPAFAQR
jgi:protein required for attachment to host cells